MDDTDRQIRFAIFRYYLSTCRPPTVQDLVEGTGITDYNVVLSLQRLADLHHLKLYGKNIQSPTPIAMVHPFSHLPTPYQVASFSGPQQNKKTYWANCSWCAFGLAAMLVPTSNEIKVNIMSPSSGAPLCFRIINGAIHSIYAVDATVTSDDCWTAFCVPLRHWWTDVHFACSCIQMCTSKREAETYHERHGFMKGEIMDLNTLWELSKAWYHDKASFDYERKTPEETRELFGRLGLTSDFWALS